VMLEATTKEEYLNIKNLLKDKLEKFPEVGKEWKNDVDPF